MAQSDWGKEMTEWKSSELDIIGTIEEIDISSLRNDSTLSKPVTIWVVRIGNNLYIRAINGPGSVWFRHTQVRHSGHISADGVEKDVDFVEETEPAINTQIDDAYQTKYQQYEQSIVNTELTSEAKSTTLKLVPHLLGS